MKKVHRVQEGKTSSNPNMQLIIFEVSSNEQPEGWSDVGYEVKSRILSYPYYVDKALINELLPTNSDPRVDSFKLCSLEDKKKIVFILHKLCRTYCNYSYIPGPEYKQIKAKELSKDVYPLGEERYVESIYRPDITGCSISPEKLRPAIQMVLCSLDKAELQQIELSDTYKRLIEEKALQEVKELKTFDGHFDLYDQYKDLGVLEHQANPGLQKLKSFIIPSMFNPKLYSTFKLRFIEALQKAMISFLKVNSYLERRNFSEIEVIEKRLKSSFFVPVHKENGVDSQYSEQLNKLLKHHKQKCTESTSPSLAIELS